MAQENNLANLDKLNVGGNMRRLLIILLLLPSLCLALPQGLYSAIVNRVVDGDTIEVTIKTYKFNTHTKKRIIGESRQQYNGHVESIRLTLIDAPETSTLSGQKCKKYLTNLLLSGTYVTLHVTGSGAYNRVSAVVWKDTYDSLPAINNSINVKLRNQNICPKSKIMNVTDAITSKYVKKSRKICKEFKKSYEIIYVSKL